MPAVGLGVILHPFPGPAPGLTCTLGARGRRYHRRRGEFIDAEVGLEWLPIPILALRIGYRYFWGKGEKDRDEAEVTLMGAYVSATLTFYTPPDLVSPAGSPPPPSGQRRQMPKKRSSWSVTWNR